MYDLMGKGKKLTYKTSKHDEATPGPGMYSSNLKTIEDNLERTKMMSSTSRLGFGASRDQ
eukprot:CAMPEP_0170498452 /NCGR_PEP_ID=MMETSP0208-20121228/27853_1 /TAXON_ID=197538 /ORGANISM="Strombidium inclinatum, Strain S3" /LENGTH=59 /DNA_ID=CAMNT_0010775627 /DNA_START=1375 /DNA_END=1554 /DNA_ORIENTATION=+